MSGTISVYLTGNSMTEALGWTGFRTLLERDNTVATIGRQSGPGYSQADNYNLKPGYVRFGFDPAQPTNKYPWANYQAAFARSWDVLSLQPHEKRLLTDIDPVSGQNQADVPMAIEFMKDFSVQSPDGQVYIYSRSTRRTDIDELAQPTGKEFDYSAEWTKPYIDSGADQNVDIYSRSYVTQYMDLLRDAQSGDPATRNLKPARLIPVGEAYYNFDQLLKSGQFAGTGVTSIFSLYKDRSHPTLDLASYMTALTFYSSMTGTDPRGVAPPAAYLTDSTSKLHNPTVQSLIQLAVYQAITQPAYAGYVTPLHQTAQTGSISGVVYSDTNRNGVFDSGEGIGDKRTVYLDSNNNGKLDSGEPKQLTNASGRYTFVNLKAGTYHVRRIFPSGYTYTNLPLDLTLTAGQNVSNADIGSTRAPFTPGGVTPPPPPPPTQLGSIRGIIYSDSNRNGLFDSGEGVGDNRTAFLDLNRNGKLDTGEASSITNANGEFIFSNLAAGTYRVARIFPSGYTYSHALIDITLSAGQNVVDVNIGSKRNG